MGPNLGFTRAVRITRFGGPEVLDVVDIHEPAPGEGQQLYDVSTAGVNSPTPTTPCRHTHIVRRARRMPGYPSP